SLGLENVQMVWDLTRDQEIFRFKTPGPYGGRPCFSPDGRRVALVWTAKEESQILIHDVQTGEALHAIHVERPESAIEALIFDPVFRPDGQQIAAVIQIHTSLQNQGLTKSNVPDGGRRRLAAWDVATGKLLFSIPLELSL